MKRVTTGIAAAVLAVALIFTSIGTGLASAAASGWLSGWANRIPLTIDYTKVGSTLTNFPVLIRISPASGTNSANLSSVFSTLGSNSQKIALNTSDGTTQCYVEVVRWDAAFHASA